MSIMLKVNSYIKDKDSFIPVSRFDGEISDPRYIEGAVEIKYQNKIILPIEAWDYVDTLWSYFISGLEEVITGNKFETYLPDQPILITFKPDSNFQNISIEVGEPINQKANVEYDDFLCMMLKEAKIFFRQMNILLSNYQVSYTQELEDLKLLEQKYLK